MAGADDTGTRRWEVRRWPTRAGAEALARRLADRESEWERLPDEWRTDTYLLPPDRPDLLPKLRGGERFEVKRRLEVRDGLELWDMPLSEPWPPSRTVRERAAELLGRALPTGEPDRAALDWLGWTVAPVDKARRRWSHEGTTVEVTETTLGWTVAFEEPGHDTLLARLARLDLPTMPNRGYGARLRSGGRGGREHRLLRQEDGRWASDAVRP